MTLSRHDPALVEKLALANRILYDQGVVDGFGHASVRHNTSSAHFLPSCNRAPGRVLPDDILSYDLNGDLAVRSDKPCFPRHPPFAGFLAGPVPWGT